MLSKKKMNGADGNSSSKVYTQPPRETGQGKHGRTPKPATKKRKSSEIHEVEAIVNHKCLRLVSGSDCYWQIKYEVKWKRWGVEYNSWRELGELRNCMESVLKYYENNKLTTKARSKSLTSAFKQSILQEITLDQVKDLASRYIRPKGDLFPDITRQSVDKQMQLLAHLPRIARDPKLVKELKSDYMVLDLIDRRKSQILNLKEWEREINMISTSAKISVINFVDLECRPLDFKYIQKNFIMNSRLGITTKALVGCDCTDCSKDECKCATRGGSLMSYTNSRHVETPSRIPIYECTEKCKCGPDCRNRLIQKGATIPLCIFKTKNGRGWGVKSLSYIQNGQFITEYVGELISLEESENRRKQWNKENMTYTLSLDISDSNCKYLIDCSEYGNVSHFINHSCSPNVEVRPVYVDCIDVFRQELPRLGIFAVKNIKIHEEINMDYLCQPVEKRGSIPNSRILCKCNSNNCRTYLY